MPLLDHLMVEFVAQFHPASLLEGRSKDALRRSLVGTVPDAVLQQRGKYGFPAPLALYIQHSGDALARDFPELVRGVPFLRPEACRDLCGEVLGGNRTRWETLWRTTPLLRRVRS